MNVEILIALGGMLTGFAAIATAIWTGRNTARRDELTSLRDAITALQAENRRLIERVSALETENTKLRQRVVELENENMALHEQIATLKTRRSRA